MRNVLFSDKALHNKTEDSKTGEPESYNPINILPHLITSQENFSHLPAGGWVYIWTSNFIKGSMKEWLPIEREKTFTVEFLEKLQCI